MTLVEFGNGSLSEFSDTSANGNAGAGYGTSILPSDWVNGKHKMRFKANSSVSPVYYGDGVHERIHMLGNNTISNTFLQRGHTFYRPLSFRIVQGNTTANLVCDEIHSSTGTALGNGPVPLNLTTRSGVWSWILRGASDPNNTSFIQWRFGEHPANDDNSTNRFSQAWTGLSPNVVLGQWFHTMAIWSPFQSGTGGGFELWVTTHGNQMVNVVPLKSGFGNAFPSPISHYPMMSLYYDRSVGGDQIVEYAAGAYGDNRLEAQVWQVAQIGYSPWTGIVTPPSTSTLSFTSAWSSPEFVNSRTGPLAPSSFGPFTTPSRVRPYNPAPAAAFESRWTIPLLVSSQPPIVSPPVATAIPDVTGTLTVGQTLTCTTGMWNNSPTSYEYNWEKSPHGLTFPLTGLADGPEPTYVITAGETNFDIRCVVIATNEVGIGAATSNAVGPVAAVGDVTAPTDPSLLTATAVGSTIHLAWTGSTDANGVAGYQIERCQGAGCAGFALLATPTQPTFVDGQLSASTTYRYRVRAIDAVPNFSGYSNTAEATIAADPEPTPEPTLVGTLTLTPYPVHAF